MALFKGSDAAVVTALKSDPSMGFDGLYDKYAQEINDHVRTLGADTATAHQVTNETLIMGAGNVESLRQPQQLGAWLLAIAENRAAELVDPDAGGDAIVLRVLPAEFRDDVRANLDSSLASNDIPDLGPVDTRGFPIPQPVPGPATAPVDATQAIGVTGAAGIEETTALDVDPTAAIGPDEGMYAGTYAENGPPQPPPPGAPPLIHPVTDDEPIAVSQDADEKRRKWMLTIGIGAVVAMVLGAFGLVAAGVGTPDDDATPTPSISVPSVSPPDEPTSAPPTTAPPTSAPPTSAPPTSAPPTSAPPTSAPPTSAPPTSAPPTSAPPTTAPPPAPNAPAQASPGTGASSPGSTPPAATATANSPQVGSSP